MRKYGVTFVLTAGLCSAAEFFSGMAARAVIGQRNFTAQQPGASDVLLGGVSGVAYANGTLIVVDDNRVSATPSNNRVLIFPDVNSFLPQPTEEIPVSEQRCPICVGRAAVVLGQPDFAKSDVGLSERGFNHPTAVATDGRFLAVADTDNNRILIWRSIPTTNYAPADLVIGQPDFKTNRANEGQQSPTARSLRGPQGVWIQDNRLYVADSINNRILIWRSMPTSNFQNADVVLGQPNFTTFTTQDLRTQSFEPKANNLLTPVSVTTDGRKLFVTDLGHARVLIWNSIPDSNQAPADVVVGQPDFVTGLSNNTKALCPETLKKDANGNEFYAVSCHATVDFPRFALSDGTRLFVADGGNDRVLVFNQIPTQNGQKADVIVGQIASHLNQVSDSANPLGRGSSDSVATPLALASDGVNLFVSDPFRRRVMVFTPGETVVPYSGIRNLFSRDVFAVGSISFSGTIKENDEITISIGTAGVEPVKRDYKYKIIKDDTFANVVVTLAALINAGGGDAQVLATPNATFNTIVLTARQGGEGGNSVAIAVTLSDAAVISAATSGATLSGGQDAAKIAPGTLVTILGENLADTTLSAPVDINPLPRELGGVQVYFDGIRAPLLMVSPTEIRAQVPWDVNDANSISAWVRIRRANGRIVNTAAVAVPIIPQNPGILAEDGLDPRPGIINHYSSSATGTVSVDGSAKAGDTATVVIEDREYTYTVVADDTLETIRDRLVDLINANGDEKVIAEAAGVFTRIRLKAKVAGPEGNGIRFSSRANESAQVILTATNSQLCCANQAGARVTPQNPARPGETIVVLGTGLGLVNSDATAGLATGFRYVEPRLNRVNEFVSALAAGKTANVLFAGLAQGLVGIYEIHLELNSDIPTNPTTQLTIAQDIYVSNIVTIPVKNPAEDEIAISTQSAARPFPVTVRPKPSRVLAPR